MTLTRLIIVTATVAMIALGGFYVLFEPETNTNTEPLEPKTDDDGGVADECSAPAYAIAKGTALVGRGIVETTGYIQGADPFVFRDSAGKTYLFTTNRPTINVPVYASEGINNLVFLHDALPKLPDWAQSGYTWAPEMSTVAEDKYALWFTARDRTSGKQCIGRAVSTRPEGPYVDTSHKPFICDEARETSIDASPYRDTDGTLYLLWKTKETVQGAIRTTIWLSPLDQNGDLLGFSAKPLITNDQEWEGDHVEAPTLLRRQDQYYLFYSAGASTSQGYLVSYATSSHIEGPYIKSQQIILGGNKDAWGAGHQSLVPLSTNEYLIYYHAVHPDRKETQGGLSRFLDYAYVCFRDGKPLVHD